MPSHLLGALVTCGLAAVGLFGCGGSPPVAAGVVTELTDHNFAGHIRSSPRTLLKFYAPWCGHCKELAPKFEAAADRLKSKGVSLAKLDASVHKTVASKYKVESFPTLIWLEDGDHIDFGGNRTTEGIVDWVTEIIGPPVTETAEPPAPGKLPNIVLRAPTLFGGFAAAAKANRTKAAWYFVPDTSGRPKVVLQHRGEEPIEYLDNPGVTADVNHFFAQNAIPLFGRLDGDTFGRYGGKGLVWVLPPMDDERGGVDAAEAELRPVMLKVARKFIGSYHVAIADTNAFKENIERMLGVRKFPAIVVQPEAGGKAKFLHAGDDMSATTIIKFVEATIDGRVPPQIKSQLEPKKNNDLIKVLVGSTIQEEVAPSTDRDVFVEIYASWCGACKAFEPEYKKLAKFIRLKKFHDLITIAKIDAPENDILVTSMEYTSFPTLYFVPAGSGSPIKYDGERTAKALWSWIKQRTGKNDELQKRLGEMKGEEL